MDIKNVIDICYLFCGCLSLSSLSELSKWNINNVKNMSNLFMSCSSLVSVPESKWNTNNTNEINYIFYGCISNWNVKNIKEIVGLFDKCSNLFQFLDLSKWDLKNNIKKISLCNESLISSFKSVFTDSSKNKSIISENIFERNSSYMNNTTIIFSKNSYDIDLFDSEEKDYQYYDNYFIN